MGAQPHEAEVARVVLVSDAGDAFVDGFVEALRAAGAAVETVGDVFAAMGMLGSEAGRGVRMMLVDVRTSDRSELRVFDVVRRYFPAVLAGSMAMSVEPTIVNVEATGWTAGQAAGRWRTLVGGAELAAEKPASTPDAPTEESSAELKLHDAVRLRMSADAGAPAVRRTPPRVAPKLNVEEVEASGAEVTPAELDALLRPEDEATEGAA